MEHEMMEHSEILLYSDENGKEFVNVVFMDETFWLTQSGMAELFACTTDNISLHLKNIYADCELTPEATTEKFSVVRKEGSREEGRRRVRLTPHDRWVGCHGIRPIVVRDRPASTRAPPTANTAGHQRPPG